MNTFKAVLGLFVMMFVVGIALGLTDMILFAMLCRPFMALYSAIMSMLGSRDWYLLGGCLAVLERHDLKDEPETHFNLGSWIIRDATRL